MYYYHGVVNGLVNDKVVKIFESGEIASAARLGGSKRIGFNENDFISVCVNLGDEVYDKHSNNAFRKYILNHFCFVIDENVVAEKTEYIPDAEKMSAFLLHNLKMSNPDKRFSDIIDEYQIRDYVPLEKVVAFGIPYNLEEKDGFIKLSNFCYLTREEFDSFVRMVEGMARDINLKVLDSSSDDFGEYFNNRSKSI